jgi:hypothetical protein
MIITAKPSVPPIARPAQSRVARGFTATATIAQTRKKVPRPSAITPAKFDPSRLRLTAVAPTFC